MQKGRIRTKRLDFTQVSNTLIFDNNLSSHARVLGCMIQAKITIPDFVLYKTTLIKLFGKQEDTFNKYWRELKTNGYLVQFKEVVTKEYIQEHYASKGVAKEEWPKLGTYFYEYEFLDVPNVEYAKEQNEKNNQFAALNEKRKKAETPEKPKKTKKATPKKSTVAKNHTVEVPHTGKDEQHKSIDLTHTDFTNIYKDDDAEHQSIIHQFYKKWTEVLNKRIKLTDNQKNKLIELVNKHGLDDVIYALDRAKNSKYLLSNLIPSKFLDLEIFVRIYSGEYDNREKIESTGTKSNGFDNLGDNNHGWDLEDLENKAAEYMERALYGGL